MSECETKPSGGSVNYARAVVADKVMLAEELASIQQQLAAALANDRADIETIRAANAKADALIAAANVSRDKLKQLQLYNNSIESTDAKAAIDEFLSIIYF